MAVEMRVDVYSHNIKISHFGPNVKRLILEYCKGLAQFGFVSIGHGRTVRQMLRIYAAASTDRSVFRIHINLLDEFLQFMEFRGIGKSSITLVKHKAYTPAPLNLTVVDKRTPLDYQGPIIDYLANDNKIKVLTLQTGKGKDQPLDSKIRIPGGWSTMGEMHKGKVVVAADGSHCEVTGVFPQGIKPVYKVTFADGRSTEAGAEHLWKVYYINTSPSLRWRVVTTMEMLRLISMPNPRVYVKLIDPEIQSDLDLPIPPYTLGAILGDGGITGTNIVITKNDKELFEEIEKELPKTLKLVDVNKNSKRIIGSGKVNGNVYTSVLKELGLFGLTSPEKFIPEIYFEGSIEQRLALLQGLMDTDGTVNSLHTGGALSFNSTSYKLATGVQYLVRSLGGIASISERKTKFTYNGEKKEGKTSYDVNIRMKFPSALFRIPRKKERTNDYGQYCENLKLRVKSIEYVGDKETQCIAIAHRERLYVTDDFIVTHNTFCANQAISRMNKRTLMIIKGMYVERWITDITESFGNVKGKLMVVRGSADLKTLIDLALENQLDASIIIITNTTMRNFIQDYEHSNSFREMNFGYNCSPDELCEVLKVGVRLIDEVHQDFHVNFRLDLYTHVDTTISLSATLKSDDPFLNKMYATAYPLNMRLQGAEFDKYISVKALLYRLSNPRAVRFKQRGRTSYSHVAYEESIMKNHQFLNNYLNMIAEIVQTSYIRVFEEGQKMLIFCATVELCGIAAKYLQKLHPDLKVSKYTAEDEYDVLTDSDICVSTLKSAGTAVDIKGLRVCLMTVAMGSRQGNEQAVGRLRKNPNFTPEFIYLVCEDIDKHIHYHYQKEEILSDKVLGIKTLQTPYRI